MYDQTLFNLSKVIKQRKESSQESSYTGYLFEQGLDKILKKIGEEATETIIAAKNLQLKNGSAEELSGEIADLLFHLFVMLEQLELPFEEVLSVLEKRSLKTGNKKESKGIVKKE